MKWLVVAGLLVCGSFMLVACSHYEFGRHHLGIAAKAGFEEIRFTTTDFIVYGAIKTEKRPSNTLIVYLEGDGSAWRQKSEPARDPTPRKPLALWLALKDPAARILYLARPGQFQRAEDPQCRLAYWSLARYSEKVVKTFNTIIDRVKKEMQVQKIGLLGYSGGGVLAALLAARRDDVCWLATVASNLDHKLWCAWHKVTPLKDSLEPKKFTDTLQKIPQIHFAGGRDQIVPPEIIQSYVDAMPKKKFIKISIEEQFDHHCCWLKEWPRLLKMIPGR